MIIGQCFACVLDRIPQARTHPKQLCGHEHDPGDAQRETNAGKNIKSNIAFDIFTGIRLALGIAWVVLVPAELLGVSSGLGYAIKDARETLAYDHLTAMVVVIGIIGFTLDTIVGVLVKKYSWQKDV